MVVWINFFDFSSSMFYWKQRWVCATIEIIALIYNTLTIYNINEYVGITHNNIIHNNTEH